MTSLSLSVSLVAVILAGAVQTAQAITLTGKVDYTGSFELPAPTFLPPSNRLAILSANVPDVVNTAGLLATLIVPPTTLTHASPVIYDPVTAPVTPLFSHASGVSFELMDFSIIFRSNTVLLLRGSGVFKKAGYDDTEGSWVLTAGFAGTAGTYTASATIPEPGLLALLGLGLCGAARSIRSSR